jgi:GPH family glycoside/pentoside/hexuronide:cation symporter
MKPDAPGGEQTSLPVATACLYAMPYLSISMLWTPLNVMQGIYIKRYGIPMVALATILLISRIYDAFADVAVGTLSDWARRRSGSRKPIIALGAALFGIAAVLVYMPPAAVSSIYLAVSLLTFFTGFALLMVPHLAWGAELAPSSQQKTSLFGLRTAAGYVGLCLFYVTPLLPMFGSSDITPATLRLSTEFALVILVVGVALSLRLVPDGPPETTRAPPDHGHRLSNLRILALNKPFLGLMSAYVLCGLGLGIWYGMIYIYVDTYLHQGALFAPLYLLSFAVGVVSSYLWTRIASAWGKKSAWAIGTCLVLSSVLATGLVGPAHTTAVILGSLLIVNTVGFVNFEFLSESILGDVVDFSRFKTGHNHAATYFAVYMFATKVIFAMGGAIGLALAAGLGFDPHATTQTGGGVRALDVVMTWLPAALIVSGGLLIHLIPMDERRHAVIRKWIDRQESRAVADVPH